MSGLTVGEQLAWAQLHPDQTLGNERTVIHPIAPLKDQIDGGAKRGSNLFHSFREFNVGEGRGVYFANPPGIDHILSRVTGGKPSSILGQLGVLGDANLLLLNPNGILFGPDATLDIQGSFHASTAKIRSDDKQVFFNLAGANQHQLLSLDSKALFFSQALSQTGSIINQGSLNVGLQESLGLASHTIINQGSLRAPGGRITLVGNQISLEESAHLDVSSAITGGSILIGADAQNQNNQTERIFIGPEVTIDANGFPHGNGGEVVIKANELTGFFGQINASGGFRGRQGGVVEVSGKEHLIFRGNVNTSHNSGTPGTVLLTSKNIVIDNAPDRGNQSGSDIFPSDDYGLSEKFLSTPLDQIKSIVPITLLDTSLESLSGDTTVRLQATNDIAVRNLADDELMFLPGTGLIELIADVDQDGEGAFLMEDSTLDILATNGRDISISGAEIRLGSIDTSFFVFPSNIITIDIDSGGSIPTTETRGTAIFTFTVPDIDGPIEDLDVRFSANHQFIPDLEVVLESPSGTSLELFADFEDDNNNFNDTIFDDDAPISINNGAAPFRGRYRTSGKRGLAVFKDQNLQGIWKLRITDQVENNAGTLFKAKDLTPFGISLGTQLIFNPFDTQPTNADTGRGHSGSIHLKATNGGIVVDTLETSNRFNHGGNITLQSTGDIVTIGAISSDAFSDRGNSAKGGDISFTSTSGNIFTNRALLSSSGDSGQAGNISLSSTSGDIETKRLLFASSGDSGRGGDISLTSTSGDIETKRALLADASDSGRGGNISVPGQAGQGGDITISSNSGNIVVNRAIFSSAFSSSIDSGEGGRYFDHDSNWDSLNQSRIRLIFVVKDREFRQCRKDCLASERDIYGPK